jgi:hypothetical protein
LHVVDVIDDLLMLRGRDHSLLADEHAEGKPIAVTFYPLVATAR